MPCGARESERRVRRSAWAAVSTAAARVRRAHLGGDHVVGLQALDDAHQDIVVIDAQQLGEVARVGDAAVGVNCLQQFSLDVGGGERHRDRRSVAAAGRSNLCIQLCRSAG
jgi:hypothetical protein